MNQPTLADEMLFENLSDETREAILRLYGGAPTGQLVTPSALVDMYRLGFEAAVEEMSFVTPNCTLREAGEAVRAYLLDKTGVKFAAKAAA